MAVEKVFCDFHHSSLLRSLIMLFEDRLGYEVYRPIGLQWWFDGYWAINNQYDTAKQYLSKDQIPKDGTPPLNDPKKSSKGVYYCYDPGGIDINRACTLEYFKKHKFKYLVASVPAHVPIFERLIRKHQKKAKLIVQMGNNWDLSRFEGYNVLASLAPQVTKANAMFYHQEFNTKLFNYRQPAYKKRIYSFVNVLENMPSAYTDFVELEKLLKPSGFEFASYGGQNRDGNMTGAQQMASKMQEADIILHSKPGGDGFGHVIHNAYAVGRPVIVRPSHYKGQLAEQLLVPGTYFDLDTMGRISTAEIIKSLEPEQLEKMGQKAHNRFNEVVNYENESKEIATWLSKL